MTSLTIKLINKGAALMLILIVGYLSSRWKVLKVKVLGDINTIVYKLALPILIFGITLTCDFRKLNWRWCGLYILFQTLAQFVVFMFCWIFKQRDIKNITTYLLTITWPNTLVYGVPIMLVIYGKSFLIYTILASVPNWFVQIPLYIFLCEKLKAQRELEGAKAITDPDEEHLLSEDTNFDENDDKSNSESSRGGESEGATGRNINGETTQNTHSDENMIDESTLLINNQTTKNGSEGKKHRKNYSNKSFRSKVLKLTLIKVSKNTLLIGVVLGTIYSLTGLYVPDVITQFYGYLGSVTLPVAMLTIGMFCYREKIIACDWKLALLIAIIKLFIYPLACYGFQMIFDIKGAPGKAMFLINALPPALATFSFGEEYKLRTDILSTALIIETFLMVPVILLWIYIFDHSNML